MNAPQKDTLTLAKVAVMATHDMTDEQRKIAMGLARKLLSAMALESPYVYAESNGKRSFTLSAKRGAVHVALVATTDIPK